MSIYLCVLPFDVCTQGFRSYRSIVVADALARRERDSSLIVAVSLYPGVDLSHHRDSPLSRLHPSYFSSIHEIVGFSVHSIHHILSKLGVREDAYIYFLQDLGFFEKSLERYIAKLKETNPELLGSLSPHPLFQSEADYELKIPPIRDIESSTKDVLDIVLTKLKRKIQNSKHIVSKYHKHIEDIDGFLLMLTKKIRRLLAIIQSLIEEKYCSCKIIYTAREWIPELRLLHDISRESRLSNLVEFIEFGVVDFQRPMMPKSHVEITGFEFLGMYEVDAIRLFFLMKNQSKSVIYSRQSMRETQNLLKMLRNLFIQISKTTHRNTSEDIEELIREYIVAIDRKYKQYGFRHIFISTIKLLSEISDLLKEGSTISPKSLERILTAIEPMVPRVILELRSTIKQRESCKK